MKTPGWIASVRNLLRPILRPSLGLQVIGAATFIAVLGGGVVGLVVTERARSAVRDNVLSNFLAVDDVASAFAASYMREAQASARELASRPRVRAAAGDGTFGSLSQDLERWNVEHPNVTVFISDLDGITRMTSLSDKSSIGLDRKSQDWFQGAITSGQPYLGAPSVSPVTNKPRVPYSIPLRDDAGIIRGVLTESIQLDGLANVIASIHAGQNARASLVDLERGVILAHPDATRILGPASGESTATERMQAGERGVLESTPSSGQAVLAAFGPVSGLPWGIMIQQPSADAFAPLDTMVRDAVRLVWATVMLAVALGAVLAVRIGRPLRRLRETAEAMAAGDLDRRAGLDRQDEAGELGRAFDHMADRLQGSVGRAHESEAAIRAVMDSVADAILTFDEGGVIDSSNLAAQRLFGYSAAELVRQSISRLVPETAAHESQGSWFGRVLSGASTVNAGHEYEGRRQDGGSFPLELATSETWLDGRRRLIVVARDITQRKRADAALRHLARHDDLTGLPNRTQLQDGLAQAILSGQLENTSVALLLIDLDRFKEINDTFGHHYGDLLLQQVGPRLAAVLSASVTIARLGGDEFGVLLPASDVSDAVPIAKKLLRALEAPFMLEGQPAEISGSIGVASYPAHGNDAATLLRQADVAMYVAKRGQTGVVVYAAEHDQHSADRLALGGELRLAIENGELFLQYQPKVDLTGRLAGVEALVRWRHPHRGMIGPDEFIGLAERIGLIKPLTRWVLDAALRQSRTWLDTGLAIQVAVNVSMHDLHDDTLPDTVARLLVVHGVAAEYLGIEITEGAIMSDAGRTLSVLTRLSALGVSISVDDFGTGYSSLSYLKRLPIDELKIDRSFVQNIATDEEDAAIVRSTIGLGHELGLTVVAEGVEDQACWDRLRQFGCDLAQGYFTARPLSAADLDRWLTEYRQGPTDQLRAA